MNIKDSSKCDSNLFSEDEDSSLSDSDWDSTFYFPFARKRSLFLGIPIAKLEEPVRRNRTSLIGYGVWRGSCVQLPGWERKVARKPPTNDIHEDLGGKECSSSMSESSKSPMSTTRGKTILGSVGYEDARVDEIRKEEFVEFDCSSFIGSGVSARVVKAIDCKTAKVVAIKRADIHDKLCQAENEITALRVLPKNCPQLVQIYAFWLDTDTMEDVIVLEYMNIGSLRMYIEKEGSLNEETCCHIAREVCKGLTALHAYNLIHCDLKLENILLNTSGAVKICDFGLLCDGKSISRKKSGTLKYFSPERLYGYFSSKVDVWGLGLCLYECAEGILPTRNGLEQERWIKDEQLELSDKWSSNFKHFISCCLQKDPRLRWSSPQLQKHPFFLGGFQKPIKFVSGPAGEELIKPVIRLLRKHNSVYRYHEDDTCVHNIANYCGLPYDRVRSELSRY